MKKTGEIVGLPIVSLIDGGEIGIVKSLVIDAKNAAIAAVVVDDAKWYKDAKLISFGDILGIGESALTIEQKSIVKQLEQTPELEALLEANVNVLNTRVLSKKGQIKGTIVEVYYDPESGKIVECHAKAENGSDFTIPVDKIYTLATAITVVADDNETMVKPPVVAEPMPMAAPVAPAAPPVAAPAPEIAPQPQMPQMEAPVMPQQPQQAQPEAPATEDANSAMQKFEDRQKKFLLGKRATRKIMTDNGVTIIDQGEEVTEEILQKAKLAGKFVELSMSLQ